MILGRTDGQTELQRESRDLLEWLSAFPFHEF